ncbi:unnamed protein product [Coregonus sp. 'balchen']|nr:unnamed protein product [Coregonus sp. 'balchen']
MKLLQDDETNIARQTKPNKWETRANRCPFSIPVCNVKDGSSLNDMLHHQAVKNQPCTSKVCEGSVMTPKSLMRCPKDAALEILPQAIDLINQYYKSFKIPKIEHHLARLEEIAMEIGSTGTYQLTMEELVFGARQAWRNAPRCIGRIQWSNLQLFDARKCKTTQDMFQFLSAITIFPQRKEDRHDFRVWNSQLVKYAGYQMPDGSIQGDPSSVEFTKICIQLGWKPQYGLFDVLPLVLQVNGEDPDLYEIPPHLILEVPMEHPQHKWFQDLGLKWYAVPAVSNMLLEIGGLEFTACPFNGWYMGTEIGVRDFCDYQRYNILEEVGRRMGLETHKLSSLWKDQALVTKNRVTITDHHSAAESFMKHMETEFRLRGGCPADWAWLVPPMSGSLTPVFHQEMVNYILSPFFYYQPDPWLTHVWRNAEKCLRKQQISFKAVARAALFSSTLMRRVLANRVRCTVLYATETGKSQTLAQRLNSMLNCAFNSRLLCMEDYNFSDMEQESLLVVVTSTFGNGDSPGNGESFKKQLFSLQYLRNKLSWKELGAERVTPTGEGDELNGQEEAFSVWSLTALKDAYKEFNIQGQLSLQFPGAERLCEAWDPLRYRVALESCPQDLITALSAIHSKTVFPMKLKSKQNLQSPHSSRSTILVELEMERSAEVMNFAPGDHVGVFPENLPQLVAGILKFLPHTPPTNQCLRLEYRSDSCLDDEKNWQTVERIPACTLSQALTYFLDVTTPPCQNLLHKLSQLARQDGHHQRLLTLAKDSREYTTWKTFGVPTFLEMDRVLFTKGSAAPGWIPLRKETWYHVSSTGGFHLPADPSTPSSETDHLYKEETLEMRRLGVLKSVTSTYSRQPGHPKVYVQDVLRERMAGEVLSVLHQKEGHLYVCGGVNMAQGVTLAVQDILSSQLGITLTQAGEYLAQLKIHKRYHEDIFGAQFQK